MSLVLDGIYFDKLLIYMMDAELISETYGRASGKYDAFIERGLDLGEDDPENLVRDYVRFIQESLTNGWIDSMFCIALDTRMYMLMKLATNDAQIRMMVVANHLGKAIRRADYKTFMDIVNYGSGKVQDYMYRPFYKSFPEGSKKLHGIDDFFTECP